MSAKTILLSALLATGCAKSAPAPATPIGDPVPMGDGTAQPAPRTSTVAMLDAYERVRAALAADDAAALPEASRALEAAVSTAHADAPPAAEPHIAAIHGGAKQLVAATDLDAARAAFGEVSRHVIALLAEDKSLAQGKHVFECPMVKGYKKWVQPDDNLQNPYMGKKMLACGGASSWN